MTCKVSLTTHCNGTCITCPVWKIPGHNMSLETWKAIWRKLNEDGLIDKIILNNTGDVGVHPQRKEMLDVVLTGKAKWLVMQTNAAYLPDIPSTLDELIISFNGGTKEAYERTTGLEFDLVVDNIKRLYPQIVSLPNAEIHCLICETNEGTEGDLLKLWSNFPGRVRVSYKYDNQQREDRTLAQYKRTDRVPCDYLDQLIVMPDGSVIMCAHDFHAVNKWGWLPGQSVIELMMNSNRQQKKIEHLCGEYHGLCEKCNYNVPCDKQIRYLR
jgi:hypothetical protein